MILILSLLLAACSGSGEARPTEPDPIDPPEPQASPEPAISAVCRSGPVPAAPGEQPVVSQRVAIDADGNAEVTIERLGGLTEVRAAAVDAARLERMRTRARLVIGASSLTDETPVPDGTTCRVEIVVDGTTHTTDVNVPTAHAVIRPLIDDLIAVRDGPPPLAPRLTARFEGTAPRFATTTTGAQLTFVVKNEGASAAQIDLDMLGSAIFGIDVHDSTGRRLPTIPPGVPPANYTPRTTTLAPNASHRFTVDLNVFSPPLPTGTYTARVRGDTIQSDTIRFTIAP